MGYDVVILANNDEVGLKYTTEVADNLIGFAKSVKLVPTQKLYSELQPKGYISDVVFATRPERRTVELLNGILKSNEYLHTQKTTPQNNQALDISKKPIYSSVSLVKMLGTTMYVPSDWCIRTHTGRLFTMMTKLDTLLIERSTIWKKQYSLNIRTPPIKTNTFNTIDLRKCVITPHRAENYITNIANVSFDPNAKCPLWTKVVSDAMCNDQQLISYLQRVLGYCLLGSNPEECFFIFYGNTTRNGKSTNLKTLNYLMESGYAVFVAPTTLVERNIQGANPELLAIKETRLLSQQGNYIFNFFQDSSSMYRTHITHQRFDTATKNCSTKVCRLVYGFNSSRLVLKILF